MFCAQLVRSEKFLLRASRFHMDMSQDRDVRWCRLSALDTLVVHLGSPQ